MAQGSQALLRLAFVSSCGRCAATPASAQVDLTGTWQRVGQNDNGASREPVDLLGMPFSPDGRAKALSYDIAALSATERQCQMYPPIYALVGPFPLQFVMVPDPVTQKLLAWKILGWGDRDETVIWMDGRPHPSKNAPHSHGGFTTGAWEGDTLTAVTTHAKLGDIKRHRGFSSDRATLTYRFNRHGDTLTVTGILEDPVYMAEPYVLTEVYRLTTNPNNFPLTACEPIEELPSLHEDPTLVPHYLPGKHPAMNEVTEHYNIPLEAVVGGPETMYPEYRKKLKDKYVMPPPCKEGCGRPPAPGQGRGQGQGLNQQGEPPAGGQRRWHPRQAAACCASASVALRPRLFHRPEVASSPVSAKRHSLLSLIQSNTSSGAEDGRYASHQRTALCSVHGRANEMCSEARRECIGGGRSRLRILRQAVENDLIQCRRDLELGGSARRYRLTLHVRDDRRHRRRFFEDRPTRQQPERHTAERVDVGATIDVRCTHRNFWSHEVGRAGDIVGGGQRSRRGLVVGGGFFHDAEIQHLDDVVLHPAMTQVDVGRFDVSVDQTAVMGLSQ